MTSCENQKYNRLLLSKDTWNSYYADIMFGCALQQNAHTAHIWLASGI